MGLVRGVKRPDTDELAQRIRLLTQMQESFSIDELRTVCFRMGVDHEDLPQGTKLELIRNILEEADRTGRISFLIVVLTQLRPGIEWEIKDTG